MNIINNIINSTGHNGISIYNIDGTGQSNHSIIGNNISNVDDNGISVGGTGAGGGYCTITGNIITEVELDATGTRAGIEILSDNNIVTSNQIYDSSGSSWGIGISGCNNNYFASNEVSGSGFSMEVSDGGTNTTIQHRDRFAIDSTGQVAAYGKAALIVNHIEDQDIFTASASGTTRLTLNNDGDLLPGTTDTQDLGSDSLRWQDLYLGAETLHIGTSITDEGTISYDTSGDILNFSTDSTTNADIAFFTNDLYLDKSSGNVGIGTTDPAQLLETSKAGDNYARITSTDGSIAGLELFRTGTGYADWRLRDESGDLYLTYSTDDFSSQNDVIFIDSPGGKIGIGTTQPSSYGQLVVKPTAGDANTGITLYDFVGDTARSWIGSSDEWHLTRTSTATRGITIASDGDVGIGTTNPGQELEVDGLYFFLSLISVSSHTNFYNDFSYSRYKNST